MRWLKLKHNFKMSEIRVRVQRSKIQCHYCKRSFTIQGASTKSPGYFRCEEYVHVHVRMILFYHYKYVQCHNNVTEKLIVMHGLWYWRLNNESQCKYQNYRWYTHESTCKYSKSPIYLFKACSSLCP